MREEIEIIVKLVSNVSATGKKIENALRNIVKGEKLSVDLNRQTIAITKPLSAATYNYQESLRNTKERQKEFNDKIKQGIESFKMSFKETERAKEIKEQFNDKIKQGIANFKENYNAAEEATKGAKGFGQRLQNFLFISHKVDKGTGKLVKTFTNFRMEMLSVMFFGMMLGKAMSGLMQPAMESAGVFELMGVAMETLFLPIALMILPLIEKLAEFFINLPEPVKKAIGVIALVVAAIGMIAAVVAPVILVLGAMFGIFGMMAVPVIMTIGIIVGAIVGFIAVIVLLYLAWENNWLGIRDIVSTVSGWIIDKLTSLRNFFIEIIPNALGRLKDNFIGIWESIKERVGNIKDSIVGFFQDIIDKIGNVWTNIKEIGQKIRNKLEDMLPDWLKTATRYVAGGVKGLLGLDDFIYTGGKLYSINPADTIMGTKGGTSFGDINIMVNTGPISSNIDVDALSRQISSSVRYDLMSSGALR